MAVGSNKKSEIKYHLNVEEFIPYAAHYNDETVITKNGELMQVIKVTGFDFETFSRDGESEASLRSLIREAIKSSVQTDDFAIWVHTMRRMRDISTGGVFENGFSKNLHEKWVKENEWRTQFVNEVYISILIEGEGLFLKNIKGFFESIFIAKEVRKRKESLVRSVIRLDDVSNKILSYLQEYGARKLSFFKRDGIYYSEIMSFASKIMNLKQEDVPFASADLSTVLPTHKVEFQYNVVQVEGATGRHFGAVLTVKEFQEVNLQEMDKFLQMPVHFIVSECFDFTSTEEAMESFKDQIRIAEISGSKSMARISGIQEILDSDNGQPTDYGKHSIVITILEDSVKGMQKSVSIAADILREIGVVFVREDLFMEDCYWSMLPGNFDFIRRQSYIPSHKIAGYASLYNFPAGKLNDNLWGPAVTIFRTKNESPYFFNFHTEEDGNTLIVGAVGHERTTLMNFLVSEAQKFKCKTYYFETGRKSKVFVSAIGGVYHNAKMWLGDERLRKLENGETGTDEKIEGRIAGFNLLQVLEDEKVGLNAVLYFMNMVENLLDESPTIIVLDELWGLFNDEALAIHLKEWLERVKNKNGLVIFTMEFLPDSKKPNDILDMDELFKTKIFLPNEQAAENYIDVFGVGPKELKAIKGLNSKKREFMLKRTSGSVTARLDLKDLKEELEVLSVREEKLPAFDNAIEQNSDPEIWLKQFYGNLGL